MAAPGKHAVALAADKDGNDEARVLVIDKGGVKYVYLTVRGDRPIALAWAYTP